MGTDRVLGELLDEIAGQLAARGHRVVRAADPRNVEDGPLDALVLTSRTPVGPSFLDRHPELRGVVFASSGVNSIDVTDATRRGVVVANGATPENYGSMAEATIMLALALRLRLPDRLAALAERRPRPRPAELDSHSLRGATLGLIGFGRIAREVCTRLAGWGTGPILSHTRTPRPGAWPQVDFCSLDRCLTEADIVSIHLPLNDATRGLIGAPELRRMQRGAVLINTSRGGIVDEVALSDALHRGHIAGAAIDTFAVEPLPADSPLRGAPNAILTDHVVGHTVEMYGSLVPAAVENAECILRGERPPYLVNPDALSYSKEGVT
ncbi:NAD(P)-dependent oxidoreductase [Streptomyces johnsoniae]|uniref:NAD(P)-dependent oxidoreductase n=1 Tax=Streptomyces johnsoniae TaxID=3075532 RepID=A0ABU2S8W5_9ACTN|nr:NAD(P)-dependent oxidoreductase [Streptomyces sp. DSM 41886]MDT0445412.1 NAD(P)-dependent oxidoreductase [Streptomyces sp. DSM 41886]